MSCSRCIIAISRLFTIAGIALGLVLVTWGHAAGQPRSQPLPTTQPGGKLPPRNPFQEGPTNPPTPRPVGPAPAAPPPNGVFAPPANNVPGTPGNNVFGPPVNNVPAPVANQVGGDLQELVRSVESSVVIIDVPGIGMGSGFVVDEEGTIATNFHVIEGARTARVTFLNKKTYSVAGFVEVQPSRDVALLQLRGLSGEPLKPLPLAAQEPGKGERVLAFGAPKGLGGSVADGIVSSVRDGRDIRDVLLKTTGQDIYNKILGYDVAVTWVQTTTPISGGNSGGPLVNLKGEVVGMNTWHRADGQNLNFAVAASEIAKIMALAKRPGQPLTLRPLSDLPKPRPQSIVTDTPQRTLEYWTKLREIHQVRKEHEQRVAIPSKTANPGRWETYYEKCAEVMAEQSKLIKEMPIDQVDTDLVLLATREAQNAEAVSKAFNYGARLVKARLKNSMYDASRALERCVRDDREIRGGYDILRIVLNKKYGMEFPYSAAPDPKEAEAETASTDDAATSEAKAKSLLNNAKKLIKIKPEEARNWLQKVITTHPMSAAAKEAETLLKDIPPPVE
jgi:S1-C subfamily serine protease